jgi:hypothetical protein
VDHSIFIGYDPKEASAFAVARHSINRRMTVRLPVFGLVLSSLQSVGLFSRPIERRGGQLWDVISEAPMSTEHANARFLVPHLAGDGWAMFVDGDILARTNVARIFDGLDPAKALYCVKHRHDPIDEIKKDGQIQTRYSRKNWSSVMVWNVNHDANRALTIDLINSVPGRDLHRFFWLDDDLIGELDQSWNCLVGVTDPAIDPKIAHFTNGIPDLPGYENVPFADEWRAELARWAA